MAGAEDSEFVRRQLKLMILRLNEWKRGRRSLNSTLNDLSALSAAIDSAEWNKLTELVFGRLEEANAMNIVESTPLNSSEIAREMALVELTVEEFARSHNVSIAEEF
jgi:hypothetical protein